MPPATSLFPPSVQPMVLKFFSCLVHRFNHGLVGAYHRLIAILSAALGRRPRDDMLCLS